MFTTRLIHTGRCRVLFAGVLSGVLACASLAIAADEAAPISTASPVLEDLSKQAQDQTRPEAERLQVIKLLGDWGTTQVTTSLLAVLKDQLPSIRAASARALGRTGDRAAASALRERVEAEGETSEVRAPAVESLGRIGDESTRAAVLAATRDPDPAVRRVALWGVTFGALAKPTDWQFFMRQAAEDRAVDLLMRCDAIRVLGELRDTASADLLTRLLESEPAIPMPLPGDQPTQQEVAMIRYRQSRDVRAWAAKSLGVIAARSALPLLLKSAEAPDDFFLRLLSVQTLVDWNAHEAVPVLIRRLEDPFPDIRAAALLGLAKIGDRSVVDAVLPRLGDQTVTVRVQAIETLVDLGGPGVREKLEALQDKNIDPVVQRALDRAFARLPR